MSAPTGAQQPVDVSGAGALLARRIGRLFRAKISPWLLGGRSILRFTTIALALTGLMAAGPAHRQPTPTSVPPQAESPDAASVNAQSGDAAHDRNLKVTEERTKAWNAKMKKTMGGVCGGC